MDNAPDRILLYQDAREVGAGFCEIEDVWLDPSLPQDAVEIAMCRARRYHEYTRADVASPLGAVVMRDAASALAMQWVEGDCTCSRCLDATHITDAIRALPLPSAPDLDRAALDRPKVRALVAALDELLKVSRHAVRLSLDYEDFKLYAMEPMDHAIAAAIRARGAKP